LRNLRETLQDCLALAGVCSAGVLLPTRQCLREGANANGVDSALRLVKDAHQLAHLHQIEARYAVWNFEKGWLWSIALDGHIFAVVSKTDAKDCPADQLFAIIHQGR
jgi:hypothetical protein